MEFTKDLGNWDECESNLIQFVRLHKKDVWNNSYKYSSKIYIYNDNFNEKCKSKLIVEFEEYILDF